MALHVHASCHPHHTAQGDHTCPAECCAERLHHRGPQAGLGHSRLTCPPDHSAARQTLGCAHGPSMSQHAVWGSLHAAPQSASRDAVSPQLTAQRGAWCSQGSAPLAAAAASVQALCTATRSRRLLAAAHAMSGMLCHAWGAWQQARTQCDTCPLCL